MGGVKRHAKKGKGRRSSEKRERRDDYSNQNEPGALHRLRHLRRELSQPGVSTSARKVSSGEQQGLYGLSLVRNGLSKIGDQDNGVE
jgi:hypothetical protein